MLPTALSKIGGAVGSALVAARCRGFESHPIFVRNFYNPYYEGNIQKGDVNNEKIKFKNCRSAFSMGIGNRIGSNNNDRD